MGLVWGEIDVDYIQIATDEQGRVAAQIVGTGWPRTAWIHPVYCGVEGGHLIRGLPSWEEGRAAVERYIAEYLARRDPGL